MLKNVHPDRNLPISWCLADVYFVKLQNLAQSRCFIRPYYAYIWNLIMGQITAVLCWIVQIVKKSKKFGTGDKCILLRWKSTENKKKSKMPAIFKDSHHFPRWLPFLEKNNETIQICNKCIKIDTHDHMYPTWIK